MKPPLLASQLLYRCERCRSVMTHVEAMGPCYSCGSSRRQPGFRFTDREIAEARQRGFIFADDNFTYVPDSLVKEQKLPGLDELFRAEE